MRLVVLYGPPGVGKLTVAVELAALTGITLFHNHLTVNLVTASSLWDLKPGIDSIAKLGWTCSTRSRASALTSS